MYYIAAFSEEEKLFNELIYLILLCTNNLLQINLTQMHYIQCTPTIKPIRHNNNDLTKRAA